MTFSAYMPSIKEIQIGTKYVLNGLNNENYKLFADAYDDSVTNSACINDISNLIKGKGLINANGGKSPSSIISDDDWGLLVLDYKKQGQTALQIIWYGGKPIKIYHIPLENTGLNVDETGMKVNGYWYCYDWKKQYKYKPVFYPKFSKENPDNQTQMLVIKRPSNEPLFARPDWFSTLRWAQDEGLMAQHSYNDVATGFSGQKVINWVGGRGLTQEEKNKTKQEILDKFTGINGQRTIVSVNASPENSVVVDNIDPPNVNATYINYAEEAERKILIAHSYPSILLAGSKTGFSSNADEIAVATKSTYRRVVNPARRTLLSPLQEIFDVIGDGTVLAVEDFESEELDNNIDGQPTERIGDKTAEQQNAEAQAQLRGSVGGVTALLEIQSSYAAKTTSYESAIAMINLIFGFTEDEAKKLLGNPQIAPIQTQFEQERDERGRFGSGDGGGSTGYNPPQIGNAGNEVKVGEKVDVDKYKDLADNPSKGVTPTLATALDIAEGAPIRTNIGHEWTKESMGTGSMTNSLYFEKNGVEYRVSNHELPNRPYMQKHNWNSADRAVKEGVSTKDLFHKNNVEIIIKDGKVVKINKNFNY